MVSASTSKELQNVLPKGNPFPLHIKYDWYRSVCIAPLPHYYGERVGVRGIPPRSLTSANRCKCDKNRLVATATTASTEHFIAAIAAAVFLTATAADEINCY